MIADSLVVAAATSFSVRGAPGDVEFYNRDPAAYQNMLANNWLGEGIVMRAPR